MIRALGLGVHLVLAAACLAAIACGAGSAKSSAPPAAPTAGAMPAAVPGDPRVEPRAEPRAKPRAEPRAEIDALDRDLSAELARAQIPPPPATCSGATCASEMSEPFSTPTPGDPTCHPASGDHCSDVCTLSTSICKNQERICELAQQLAGDDWAAGKCTRARASCQAAHDACCRCVL